MKVKLKQNRLGKFILLAAIGATSLSTLQAQSLKPEQNNALLQTAQGSIVELPGFLSEKIPSIEYQKVIAPGPQFIISDDPEYIRVPEAIVLKEQVQPGTVRLYVYNVNGVREPEKIDRKITALIKNTGNAPMHIRMLNYSSQKPSTNYFQIGKQGLADYFASNGSNTIRKVKPGEIAVVDEKLEKHVVKYDELVHGFYEFVIDQPGEISILQTDPKTPGPKAAQRIKNIILPSGANAGRGLFGVSNYSILTDSVFDTKNGAAALIIADGKKDPWILGKEGVSGNLARNAGNYGVMYTIDMKWKSSDGKGLALVTWNARSGDNKWCGGMAASMVVSKGKFDAGIIQLPKDRLTTKGAPEAVLIQVFPPATTGEEQHIKLTYSPPGASCLPTPLIFIPVDMK